MARSTSKLMFAVPLVLAGALLAAILWWPFEVNASDLQQTLIQAGVDPDDLNKVNKNGDTALIGAAYQGHTATAQALIQAGADVNKANKYGDTALVWSAYQGHTATVKALIQAGADLNKVRKYGDTALVGRRLGATLQPSRP